MIQPQTYLNLADNSGAKQLMCLSIPGASRRKYASIGDVISVVVKGANPGGVVSNAQRVRALVVRTKKEKRRADGSYIRFDDNAAVIIDKAGNPVGTRILGPIPYEIKALGYDKIASKAQQLV